MKKNIFFIGLLIAFSLSTIFAKTSFKESDAVQVCSLNWLEAYNSVQNTIVAVNEFGVKPKEFFVVKSASTGSTKYTFTAIAVRDNEASLIYNTPSLKRALVRQIKFADAKYWLKQFEAISKSTTLNLTADLDSIENTECEFLYGKNSSGVDTSITVLGMLDKNNAIEIFLNKLDNFSKNLITNKEKFTSTEFAEIPTKSEQDKMSELILSNRFFEIESWN